MAFFGLLFGSLKGLYTHDSCPISLTPISTVPSWSHRTQTHARTTVTPCYPRYYNFSLFFRLEVLDQVFKQLIFLSLTCVFYFLFPSHWSLVCSPLFLFSPFAIVKLEANILNGFGTGLGSGCEENPLFLHKTSVYWITWEAHWALCVD